MELIVLNENFQTIDYVDVYESLIWNERYLETGNFELYVPVQDVYLELTYDVKYINLVGTKKICIVEKINISSSNNENKMVITGRNISSIFDRRIIWNQTSLSDNINSIVQTLINQNVISPSDPDRAIPNITYIPTTDPDILSVFLEVQFDKDNLLESILAMCSPEKIEFRVELNDTRDGFVCYLRKGLDHSFNQILNPLVEFSKDFDNLVSTEYTKSEERHKNLALVTGEGDSPNQKQKVVGTYTGLSRKEVYIDSGSLTQDLESGGTMPDVDYYKLLEQKGLEELDKASVQEIFDSQVDIFKMFKYEQDFFIGDIIQIDSGYGIKVAARVVEITQTQNLLGYYIYPKFEID